MGTVLDEAVNALRDWQYDGAPIQLHPGDLGWAWSGGPDVVAAALRTWSRDGKILAVGLIDGPVLRLAVSPDAQEDEALALEMVADVTTWDGPVEVRWDGLFPRLLLDDGWGPGEPWTPLRRDLTDPVEDPGLRIEIVGPELVSVQTAVHRSAFGSPKFTDERWHAMAGGPAYADARSLLAYDEEGNAVATVTVWSAGPGKPGLLEPLGVHAEHRGHGYGTAMAVAAAAALQDLGSSSAIVCTPSSNITAVATYASAGFQAFPEVPDLACTPRAEPREADACGD